MINLLLYLALASGTDADVPVQSGRVTLSGNYVFHRPVVLDADNVEVTGGTITAQCTPAFVVGVKAVTPNHYPVSTITGKTAYRTLGNARLNLPADAFDVGNAALTVEFIVEQNTPAPGQVGLFGTIRQQIPQPWYCAVVDGKFQFRFTTVNGIQSFFVPWPVGVVTGKVYLDTTAGTLSITLNGVTKGYAFLPGALSSRNTPYFGVGALADRAYGWGDYVGGPHDWTYHALKVTGGPSSGIQANEPPGIPFCRLLCDMPGPIRCHSDRGEIFGFMLNTQPDQNRKRCRIHDLTITSSLACGPLISVGGIYSPSFERLVLSGGGQSIASLGGSWSYPVWLTDCELGSPYFGHGQSLYANRTNFQYCGAEFRDCFVSMRDTFVAGNPRGGTMFKGRDGTIGNFDVGQADYEGLPPDKYFDFDSSCPTPRIVGWIKGKNTPIVI